MDFLDLGLATATLLLLLVFHPKLGFLPPKHALIIVDVQNCFLPGGALPVPNGHEGINPINLLKSSIPWDYVILTQDWHPESHVSFASAHEAEPFGKPIKL